MLAMKMLAQNLAAMTFCIQELQLVTAQHNVLPTLPQLVPQSELCS